MMRIREFQAGDEAAFRELNTEWITKYFVLEPKDLASFGDPQGTILSKGGHIYLAEQGGVPVGCVALLLRGQGEYEVGKMAVTPAVQGTGVGRKLMLHAIEAARELGAERLYLETHHSLLPAVSLYRSVGFTDVPEERRVPSPYARATVFLEMELDTAK